ncbi:ABC transporter ATP-binding protein [Tissierella creatinophila]|uniref:Putative ABC transporter ATP-binding protein YbhF n=1 Tax=Tissierella creatinophila DSM 6911 TaxID=1123403 RepID=A0A1U7M7H3_TISCR|nr:ATP-binding cassette domain-containing protein [Tissierella creatinophila]OLS03262.1 putative ABC transporter ATP-binding protein YbhF [Tissierella creatinophila DSM 6911]
MKIEVNDFTKIISKAKVLENINICLEGGNIYGIIGRNGSGKTMFLRMLCGLILPTSGMVKVDGKVLGKDISFPENLGILLEKPSFLPNLTGYENLQMLSDIRNITPNEKIQSLMNLFELDWKSKKTFNKYSLGMKQKLGIIQAIMENQQIIILDEPFNALDEVSVEKLRKILESLRDEGKLIVMTSHNKEDIDLLCDHTYTIVNGKMEAEN